MRTRLIDANALLEANGLSECTKYDNNTAERQKRSYDTMMMYEIKDMIEDAPTIETFGSWISAEDRMPKENMSGEYGSKFSDTVFVAVKNKNTGQTFTTTDFVLNGDWYIHGRESKTLNVIYWMPLPEIPNAD